MVDGVTGCQGDRETYTSTPQHPDTPSPTSGANVRITVSNRDLLELRVSLQCGDGAASSWSRSGSNRKVRSSPRRGVQAGPGTGLPPSVASHDARHPFPLEALARGSTRPRAPTSRLQLP